MRIKIIRHLFGISRGHVQNFVREQRLLLCTSNDRRKKKYKEICKCIIYIKFLDHIFKNSPVAFRINHSSNPHPQPTEAIPTQRFFPTLSRMNFKFSSSGQTHRSFRAISLLESSFSSRISFHLPSLANERTAFRKFSFSSSINDFAVEFNISARASKFDVTAG